MAGLLPLPTAVLVLCALTPFLKEVVESSPLSGRITYCSTSTSTHCNAIQSIEETQKVTEPSIPFHLI